MKNRRRLGHLLVDRRVVTEVQLEAALQYQREKGVRLGDALLQLGYCDEVEISRALADQLGLPFADLDQEFPTPNTLQLLRREVAQRCQVVPVRSEHGRLTVVARNPLNFGIDSELRAATGMSVTVACGVDSQIARVLDNYERFSRWEAQSLGPAHLQYADARLQGRASELRVEQARGEVPTPATLTRGLSEAILGGATELQFELEGNVLTVYTSQNGKPVALGTLPAANLRLVIGRPEYGAKSALGCRVTVLDRNGVAPSVSATPYSAPVIAASAAREAVALLPRRG